MASLRVTTNSAKPRTFFPIIDQPPFCLLLLRSKQRPTLPLTLSITSLTRPSTASGHQFQVILLSGRFVNRFAANTF